MHIILSQWIIYLILQYLASDVFRTEGVLLHAFDNRSRVCG